MYEDNLDYAVGRLLNTNLQHKGRVVWVRKVNRNGEGVVVADLEDFQGERSTAPLSDLDHTPLPLGYVPNTTRHLYVERAPRRRWKQGAHPDNVRSFDFNNIAVDYYPSLLDLQSLLDGVYPPKEEVLKTGGAFSRSFFVSKDKHLYYKTSLVGTVEDGRIILLKGKEYLSRRLEKTQ